MFDKIINSKVLHHLICLHFTRFLIGHLLNNKFVTPARYINKLNGVIVAQFLT